MWAEGKCGNRGGKGEVLDGKQRVYSGFITGRKVEKGAILCTQLEYKIQWANNANVITLTHNRRATESKVTTAIISPACELVTRVEKHPSLKINWKLQKVIEKRHGTNLVAENETKGSREVLWPGWLIVEWEWKTENETGKVYWEEGLNTWLGEICPAQVCDLQSTCGAEWHVGGDDTPTTDERTAHAEQQEFAKSLLSPQSSTEQEQVLPAYINAQKPIVIKAPASSPSSLLHESSILRSTDSSLSPSNPQPSNNVQFKKEHQLARFIKMSHIEFSWGDFRKWWRENEVRVRESTVEAGGDTRRVPAADGGQVQGLASREAAGWEVLTEWRVNIYCLIFVLICFFL